MEYHDSEVQGMDVLAAHLKGEVEEDIFMTLPNAVKC